MSSSTVPIPAIPKLSTRTFVTFGDRNAGSVGPTWMFFTPRYRSARSTITAFCSYHAMLYMIGRSLMSSSPNTSFSFSAISASEYESLHCPASSTLGIPPMSPRFSLLLVPLRTLCSSLLTSFFRRIRPLLRTS